MRNNILLTYRVEEGYRTYDWFAGIEEVNEFLKEQHNITELIECIDCTHGKKVDFIRVGNTKRIIIRVQKPIDSNSLKF